MKKSALQFTNFVLKETIASKLKADFLHSFQWNVEMKASFWKFLGLMRVTRFIPVGKKQTVCKDHRRTKWNATAGALRSV